MGAAMGCCFWRDHDLHNVSESSTRGDRRLEDSMVAAAPDSPMHVDAPCDGDMPTRTSDCTTPVPSHTVYVQHTFLHVVEDGDATAVRQRSRSSPPVVAGSPCSGPAPGGPYDVTMEEATAVAFVETDDEFEGEQHGGSGRVPRAYAAQQPPGQDLRINAWPMNSLGLVANASALGSSQQQTFGQARQAPPSFDHQVQMVVSFAENMLSGLPMVQSQITESKTGWSFRLYLHQDHEMQLDELVALAKRAVLEAGRRTTSLYMLRYGRSPVVTLPQGFAVIFVGVEAGINTCWRLIQRGKCSDSCQNAHPTYRKNLVFQFYRCAGGSPHSAEE